MVLADPEAACDIIWGRLYGIASLGQLDNERARQLAQQALRTLLQGWRTGQPDSA